MIDIHDKTDFADAGAGYRTHLAGIQNWTATVEAHFDSTNTADPGDSALLSLITTTGTTYSGTAMISSIAVSEAATELVTATYEFVANGLLTRAS